MPIMGIVLDAMSFSYVCTEISYIPFQTILNEFCHSIFRRIICSLFELLTRNKVSISLCDAVLTPAPHPHPFTPCQLRCQLRLMEVLQKILTDITEDIDSELRLFLTTVFATVKSKILKTR